MRRVAGCLFLIIISAISLCAQALPAGPRENPAFNLWLVRSQTITEDLIKDATELSTMDRVLLWGRLAQRWWRANPEKSRAWIEKALDIIQDVPNRENPTERRQRLETARSLLRMVTPLDQSLSKQLISFLTDNADAAADAERNATAAGLVEAAMSLVNSDPKRAAEMGALALRVGRPQEISSLILALRRKEGKLADALLAQALDVAREPLTSEFLNSLTYAAFPESTQTEPNVQLPPENLRIALLRLDLAYLQANPINAENRSSICATIGAFISPLIVQFDRLLPQQAATVRRSILQCDSTSPLVRQRMDDALNGQPLDTVEALLKAADDAKDLKVRTVYQYRAATLAKEKKDLDRALRILDSIDKDGREFMGGSWEAYRWEWAALSALAHFKNEDIYGMRLVINGVPADLQPFAKLAFVQQLPAKRNKETDPTLEYLAEARTGLARANVSDAEKCSWYFGLLRLAIKYLPGEATAILKETVAALNRAGEAKDKDGKREDHGALLESISSNLPASLMEIDEYAVKEAVSAVAVPEIRAQIRLDLLSACLARFRSLQDAAPKTGTPNVKGE